MDFFHFHKYPPRLLLYLFAFFKVFSEDYTMNEIRLPYVLAGIIYTYRSQFYILKT